MAKTTPRSRGRGCAVVLLVLFLPAILTSFFLKSAIWLIAVPIGIIVLTMTVAVLAALLVIVLEIKSKLTPEQFADRLEKHLLFYTENRGTDDTLPSRIADERLERLALHIYTLDLRLETDRNKVRAMIAVLRRGEIPETVPPTHLTYNH
jgi:hypothetical protein